MKYLQIAVLVCLFIAGTKQLNKFRNLGFMIFFAVYTANESLYRSTSGLLTIYISFFIFGQYYYSLTYYRYEKNERLMERLEWLNMFEKEKFTPWTNDTSIYFRHTPYAVDMAVLLVMASLNIISTMYVGEFYEDMAHKCEESISGNYVRSYKWYTRISGVLTQLLTLASLAAMMVFCYFFQTNLISWIFFSLTVVTYAFISKADNKKSTLTNILNTLSVMKYYSSLILLAEIFFIVLMGDKESKYDDTPDYWLRQRYPNLYWYLSIIGFRMHKTSEMRDKGTEFTFE